jgi:hypothetical protein
MTPASKPPRDPLDRLAKIAWLLVFVEGVALLGAIYFIWAARGDIGAIFRAP